MELDNQNDRLILEYHKKNGSTRLWERLTLSDIKTGWGVYPDYKLKLAAYAVAWGELNGCLSEICMNLHVRSDLTITQANRFTATVLVALFQTFLTAKQLLEWLSDQQTSERQNAEVAHLAVALSSNGGHT
jgi:hypothetical protein